MFTHLHVQQIGHMLNSVYKLRSLPEKWTIIQKDNAKELPSYGSQLFC